jgi:hypothetical protein
MNKNKRKQMDPFLKRIIILFIVFITMGFIIAFTEKEQGISIEKSNIETTDTDVIEVVTSAVTTTHKPVTTITTTTTVKTTVVTTTMTVKTTTVTTTTTQEIIYYDYEEDPISYEEEEEYIYTTDEESVVEDSSEEEIISDESYNNGETYYGTFEGTFYEGGPGTYGYSGRDLISGYSVASNLFPQGSIIRVEGSGLDGTYRVDDTGGMAGNVVDFYYQYGETPSDFRYHGRVSIEVYLIN